MAKKPSTRRRRAKTYRLHVMCSGCRLEVSDPGEPLSHFRCPECGAGLVRISVRNTGVDRPLPAPKRVKE